MDGGMKRRDECVYMCVLKGGGVGRTHGLSGSFCVFNARVFPQKEKPGRHKAVRQMRGNTYSGSMQAEAMLRYLCVLIHSQLSVAQWFSLLPHSRSALLSNCGCFLHE